MILTIHGLPSPIKYHDIKLMIKQQCGHLSDFVLDNLQEERWGTKRVSIEVSDQRDAAYMIKCLDGFNLSGNKLQVVPADKNMAMNQAPQMNSQSQVPSNLYSNSAWPSLNLQPPTAAWSQGMYKGAPQGNGPHPGQGHAQGAPQDQRYGMQRKDDPNQRQKPDRAHGFRNVEVIDAPINRGNQRYPDMTYEAQQKPMTIKHDNFQGPTQYGMTRPTQGSVPYQGQAPVPQQHGAMGPNHGSQGHGHGHQQQGHGPQPHMMNQPALWNQQAQSDRYPKQGPDYDRKYLEPNQSKGKVLLDRGTDYNKGVPGPRFSPRRDKDGPRFSPRRDVEGPRFSPRRDKEGMKYPGMEKDRYPNQPRFSPRREVDGRFMGDSREAVGGRRYSPPRDVRKDGRDGKELLGPKFSPRRDLKDAHGPRFSPRRDLKGVPGPRFSPRRDTKEVPGSRFSPRRDLKGVPGPRFSPRRDTKEVPGSRFSPIRDLKEVPGPRFSPRRDLKGVLGPRFSPRRDMKEVPGSRFSPRRDVKVAPGPRFSPKRDLKAAGPRFSPRRDLKHSGPRFSPKRDLNEGPRPRFSPRRDVKEVPGPRFSPQRELKAGPRFSPRKEFVDRGRMPSPGRRISPGRGGMTRGRSPLTDKRFGSPTRRDSPNRQHPTRFSPSRHFDKDKYTDGKEIRPAYEPTAQAPKQAMYSGGFRPIVHDAQYPVPGFRPQEPSRPTWDQDKPFSKKEDIRDARMPKFEPRIENVKAIKSRSPIRRDRSPGRDRFRKHSPSPKSPRRSWALEKRHSPDIRDAPPPPVWPGHSRDEDQFRSRGFPDKVDHRTKQPVWERPGYEEKPLRERMDVEDRRFIDKGRVDVPRFHPREPSPRSHGHKPEDHFARNPQMPREREPKFEPKYEDIRRDKPDLRPTENPVDIRRQHFSRPEEILITKPEEFNKELQDIYQRAIDLNKRGKEFRKNDDRRRFSEEHQREHQEKDYDRKFREDDRRRDRNWVEGDQGYRRDMRPESPRQGQHRVPRRDSPRRDLSRGDLPREDLPREDLPREERRDIPHRRRDDRIEPRYEDRHQSPPRQRQDPQWAPVQIEESRFKRERAVDEITNKLMERHANTLSPDVKMRVYQELKIAVMRILKDIFGHKEVSFIECVVKFQAQFALKDEIKLVEEVMSSLPGNLRKRAADEVAKAAVPAKTARMMENPGTTEDLHRQMPQEQNWNKHISQIAISQMGSMFDVTPEMMGSIGVPVMAPNPAMVPNPFGSQHFNPVQLIQNTIHQAPNTVHQVQQMQQIPDMNLQEDGYNLYLCKDNFEPYTEIQAEQLKNFLITQMINVSQTVHGWAPDFTLKGLQSMCRYELTARDDDTKRWILDLDFSQFTLFNVLVYTNEELWYERAAIWLPGHSRTHNLTPFTKLVLQNQKLDGINIAKWKFVRQIVTFKGTRVYVDMPPSSARALEHHKLMLSYELQKVNVFLKAIAVDKEAFDNGLKERSINEEQAVAENIPMPSLANEPSIIKIGLKGDKPLTVEQASKIKEMIVNRVFKYQQSNNRIGRTDFIKYGYCLPGYFGVVPANDESRRWLLNLNIGTLKKHPIVVIGGDEDDKKLIRMKAILKNQTQLFPSQIFERIKVHNKGIKGVNFNKWNVKDSKLDNRNTELYIDMDLDSVESLARVDYKLDYVYDRKVHTVALKYEGGNSKLEEVIKKLKDETKDSYDVANMDIASDNDDDIVYLGPSN